MSVCLGATSNLLRCLVLLLCTLFFLKIKVSVSSGGDCIRTYKPEIKKGSYNNIIINVKTPVADNLLFYLGSAKFVSQSLCECAYSEINFGNKKVYSLRISPQTFLI